MSALSWPLQQAVFAALSAAPAVTDLADVLDMPEGETTGDYVSIGQEIVRSRGAASAETLTHDLTVEVHSRGHGFARAKEIAGAVTDTLLGAPLTVAGARVIGTRFVRSRARRARGLERRRIELVFRIILERAV